MTHRSSVLIFAASVIGCLPDPPTATSDMAFVALSDAVPVECPGVTSYRVGYLFDVGDGSTDCVEPDGTPIDCPETQAPDVPPGVPLFTASVSRPPALPDALARYCWYLPQSVTDGPAGLDAFRVSQAAKVVATGAPNFTDTCDAFPSLRDYYAARTRAESGLCEAPVADQRLRLTFIDDAPTLKVRDPARTDPLPSESHGLALAEGVDELLCASDLCTIDVRTRAGLPLRLEADTELRWTFAEAGEFGARDWLAQSIVREVNSFVQWRSSFSYATPPDMGPKLILNLSLGWHEDWNDEDGDEATTNALPADSLLAVPTVEKYLDALPADARAVFDALVYARCAGAIVYAAAGNRMGGDKDAGPLYPAKWSQFDLKDADCAPYLGLAPFNDTAAWWAPGPLLVSVGAVGTDGEPLAISRRTAQGTVAAFGQSFDSVVAHAERRTPVTGTSAAAAIVSAVTAREILTGTLLWPFSAATLPRTCSAGGACRVEAKCTKQPPLVLQFPEPWSAVVEVEGGSHQAVADQDALWNAWLREPSSSYRPFAFPQPTDAPCPACGMDFRTTPPELALDLVSLRSASIKEVKLATTNGGTWTEYPDVRIPSVGHSPGTYRIQGVGGPVTRAQLRFKVGNAAYVSEIAVLP